HSFSFYIPRRPLRSTLFPYTTLFRSMVGFLVDNAWGHREPAQNDHLVLKAPKAKTRNVDGEAAFWETSPPMAFGRVESFDVEAGDRKSTRLNSSHVSSSYAVFCLKKK